MDEIKTRQEKGLRGLQNTDFCRVHRENIGTGLEVQVKVRLPKLITVQNAV